jgi:hypothetical protein
VVFSTSELSSTIQLCLIAHGAPGKPRSQDQQDLPSFHGLSTTENRRRPLALVGFALSRCGDAVLSLSPAGELHPLGDVDPEGKGDLARLPRIQFEAPAELAHVGCFVGLGRTPDIPDRDGFVA